MRKSSDDKNHQLAEFLGHWHKIPGYDADYPFSQAARDELLATIKAEGLRTICFTMNICTTLMQRSAHDWTIISSAVDQVRTGLQHLAKGLKDFPPDVLQPMDAAGSGLLDGDPEDIWDAMEELNEVLRPIFAIVEHRKGKRGQRTLPWQSFIGFMVAHTVGAAGHSLNRDKDGKLVRVLSLCLSELKLNGESGYNISNEVTGKRLSQAQETGLRILRKITLPPSVFD